MQIPVYSPFYLRVSQRKAKNPPFAKGGLRGILRMFIKSSLTLLKGHKEKEGMKISRSHHDTVSIPR
jgi:hypothetical protein